MDLFHFSLLYKNRQNACMMIHGKLFLALVLGNNCWETIASGGDTGQLEGIALIEGSSPFSMLINHWHRECRSYIARLGKHF